MKKVTCDDTKHKTYTVPVGRCTLHTSVYVPNFVDMHHNAIIYLGKSHGRTYAKNVVALEPGWIRDNFEFCES